MVEIDKNKCEKLNEIGIPSEWDEFIGSCEINLKGVDLNNVNFENADIAATEFRNANLVGSTFQNADMRHSLFEGAKIDKSEKDDIQWV